MKSVCVFCGSSSGENPAYRETAEALGREIAGRGIELVYGGGDVGLMGAIADATLAAGGRVIGFIPRALMEREIAHKTLSEIHVTLSMHERKAAMEIRAEGFIALPGGFGTLDEFCEILTWAQLGIHQKPIGMLDINGFFRHLLGFFDDATAEGFIRPAHLHGSTLAGRTRRHRRRGLGQPATRPTQPTGPTPRHLTPFGVHTPR